MSRLESTRRGAAELLIIAAGVLLALLAEEWRQAHQDRDLESEYIARLIADLESDSAQTEFADEVLERKLEALPRLSSLSSELSDAAAEQVARDLASASSYSWSWPAANSATFDEMTSTGRLGLLSEPEARSSLVRYYADYTDAVATLGARRTRFGPLTYELVPRPLNSADGRVTDFQVGDLSGLQIRRLQQRETIEAIRSAATAELNYSGWSKTQIVWLRESQAQLLALLRRGG